MYSRYVRFISLSNSKRRTIKRKLSLLANKKIYIPNDILVNTDIDVAIQGLYSKYIVNNFKLR